MRHHFDSSKTLYMHKTTTQLININTIIPSLCAVPDDDLHSLQSCTPLAKAHCIHVCSLVFYQAVAGASNNLVKFIKAPLSLK